MNLQLFLSDRCNMACDYCWLSLNRGPAVVLSEDAARRAVAEHLARHGREASVTLLGGEPMIHAELVRAILREVDGRAPVAIATNGTLACPELLRELDALGARLVVSLDGAAETHDAHRPFVSHKGSSHDEILKALESLSIPLSVNMVVRADTAGALLRNVEFLRARGFKRLSFHPHVLDDWGPKAVATLAATLEGFARYYSALPAGALELTHLGGFSAAAAEHGDDSVILGADGSYYPCDGLFALPYSKLSSWSLGDARSGLDVERRKKILGEAQRAIHQALGGVAHFTCPREPHFYALANGRDPAAAARKFHAADRVFGEALRGLAAREAVGGR